MRVLIDYRPALRARSGAGEYTHQLIRALLAAFPPSSALGSLDLTIFSSSWRDRLTLAPELRGVATVDRRVPVRLLNLAWHRLGWPPAETLARRDFDVTHSSHPLLMPSRDAAQIVTIHDLYFLAHPERTRAEIRRDYPDLVREHARRAARVLVPSQFTAGQVEQQLDVAPDRIAVCPPGAPDWSPRDRPNTDGYILFFGTLEPRKNIAGLLDAYERLVSRTQGAGGAGQAGEAGRAGGAGRRTVPELVLAGRATDDARPWLERLTRPPLAGRVRHLGYVDPAHRQDLYAGARLLVLPSFDEGFGLPVLEAMTCGVPVVASNRGSLPEVLGDAGPLVNPDDPIDMAAAMARVLEDDGYAAECAARGYVRARQFSWERTAQIVYRAYEGAVAERRTVAVSGPD